MLLTVNGTPREVADGASVPEVLEGLGLRPGSVVVERNGTALLPSEVPSVLLTDGDVLELVKAVAGG